MASPSDPLLDERHEELAALLRDSRPRASEQLREQVRELASRPAPAREPRRFGLPRLAPVALAVLVLAAVIGGVALLSSQTSGGSRGESEAAGGGDTPASAGAVRESAAPYGAADAQQDSALGMRAQEEDAPPTAAALPPATGRAQEYRAELSVRVPGTPELSEATEEAMRITRRLGGFVVAARYEEPGDADGDSLLVVRVPVGRVQDAISQFSQLGTILAQNISVADLQAQLDRQADAIAAIKRRIARLETQLEDPTLDEETRNELKLQLLEARRNLTAREGGRAQTKRRAATARVALTLTTREQVAPPPPPAEDSGVGATLKDALGVLATVLTWTLASLIVASPALVLLALLVVAVRMRRRAEERRLLQA
jgi:hypothetical protein